MSSATVTSKGQVTIPKDVRERLRLIPGTRVRFVIESDMAATMRRYATSIRDLYGFLAPAPRTATIEEMNEAIVEAAAERYLRAVKRRGK
jgi:AbrB family looped-hinge helix DNA binding protein